jgi:hypothetical protein
MRYIQIIVLSILCLSILGACLFLFSDWDSTPTDMGLHAILKSNHGKESIFFLNDPIKRELGTYCGTQTVFVEDVGIIKKVNQQDDSCSFLLLINENKLEELVLSFAEIPHCLESCKYKKSSLSLYIHDTQVPVIDGFWQFPLKNLNGDSTNLSGKLFWKPEGFFDRLIARQLRTKFTLDVQILSQKDFIAEKEILEEKDLVQNPYTYINLHTESVDRKINFTIENSSKFNIERMSMLCTYTDNEDDFLSAYAIYKHIVEIPLVVPSHSTTTFIYEYTGVNSDNTLPEGGGWSCAIEDIKL